MTDLRQLEAAATPGPWKVGFEDGSGSTWITVDDGEAEVVSGTADSWGVPQGVLDPADAALIAALRNAAPYLLDVVDAARALKRTNWYADALGRKSPEAIAFWDATVGLDEHLEKP